MKRKAWCRFIIVCAAMLCCWNLRAQDAPNPPYATVTYSDGSSVVSPGAGTVFPTVGLQSGQPVQVVVQLAASYAKQLFIIQSLDGGAVAPPRQPATPLPSPSEKSLPCLNYPTCNPEITIPWVTTTSAELAFTFVPGSLPGNYRVALRSGTGTMLLEFWVLDPTNPQNNPPVITPAQPDNF